MENIFIAEKIQRVELPRPTVDLKLAGDVHFILNDRKPLNKFQILMYKLCFDIEAENLTK